MSSAAKAHATKAARRVGRDSAVVPVEGAPALEATVAASMLSGVLVGLLIADSALPSDELDLPVAGR